MFAANSSQRSDDKLYVDDVFSTYLYTGNGSTQTINNGIDLAGEGGLVWIKRRTAATNHVLFDTVRGAGYSLSSGTQSGQSFNITTNLRSFNSSGFEVGSNEPVGASGSTYASWTFRKAPKFFDVVTYTGNGATMKSVPHKLGIVPGCIIVKNITNSSDWNIYFNNNNNGIGSALKLNTTDAAGGDLNALWGSPILPFSNHTYKFNVGSSNNASGVNYVAYLFAHDPSADGIIQCGSYTGNGSATGPSVTLGWEPQYLMIKKVSGTGNWQIIDNMRDMPVVSADATLQANLSNAESSVDYVSPTATGFQVTSTSSEVNTNGSTYIYLAIRRSNKPPTSGSQVFAPVAYNGASAHNYLVQSNIVVDWFITSVRNAIADRFNSVSRLTGDKYMLTVHTAAETTGSTYYPTNPFASNTGVFVNSSLSYADFISYNFRRAPGSFDVVCYTGTGEINRHVQHSFGGKPELIIHKARNELSDWWVSYAASGTRWSLKLNDPSWLYANVGSEANIYSFHVMQNGPFTYNASGVNYVAYLFASLPGISKVGIYTGNGSSQIINCGFSSVARFVLIKRTDNTGDWYVWDTARGIVSANDPHLSLNTTAAEVTTDDSVDPESTGFIVNQNTSTNINVNGASYIYLAIA